MPSTAITDGARLHLADAGPAARVIDAALRCIGRWGFAKTTLDDVAREAGCSRATVYRLFPGGKDVLLEAVVAAELDRFLAGLGRRLEAVDGLEDVLVAGMTYTARALRHHEPLQFLLVHEPEQVLPHVCFDRYDAVLAGAAAFVAPYLRTYLGDDDAARAGEWLTRLVLSYALCPSPTLDVTDEDDVRRFVRTFLLPGLTGAPQPLF